MERRYPNLSKPITLGRTTFRNHMFSSPMSGTDVANDGCIGPKSTAFYELCMKEGAGEYGDGGSPENRYRPLLLKEKRLQEEGGI